MDEILEEYRKKLGISKEQHEQTLQELQKSSNAENMGNLMAMIMQNSDMTANMVASLMAENAALKDRVAALEGGAS